MPRTHQPRTQTRTEPADGLHYRTLSIRRDAPNDSGPATFDRSTRSVEVVAATETPTRIFDWERWELVDEVLLMSGLKLPGNRKIPLLDAHSRFSSADVLGSARELRVAGGELLAKAVFSTVPRAEEALVKLEEEHLTDFSIGYRVAKSVYVPENQSQVIDGRTFAGPVKVATDWTVKELSITPIGADERAKARSESPQKEEKITMDKKTREFLIKRGLAVTATDDEAWAYLETLDIARSSESPATPAVPAVPAVNEDAIREEAVRSEQARILEIRAMCERFDCGDLAIDAIKQRKSVDDVRRLVLDHVGRASTEGHGYRPPVEMQHDERDKFRAAAGDALMLRLGQITDVAQAAPGARELAGFSLRELARECLRIANQPVTGSVVEMVGRALMTSDLPYLLEAGSNKMLLAGWEAQDTTYQQWCAIDSLPDFKAMNLINLSEASDLDEIPEGTKYTHGEVRDTREQAYLLTYGKIFAITRQAVINDDLGAMTRVPEAYGRSARRKVNALAYAILTANAAMGDGVVLFHSTHANIGTSAVISATSIGQMSSLMRRQTGIGSLEPLNIMPRYLIAPVSLEATAEAFFNTIQIANAAGEVLINQYAGNRITRVYDPLLDVTDTTDWYMAAEKGMTVTVFFLQGQSEPHLERQQGWDVDGMELKVRIDAAAKAVDWRGLVFNEGGS